jgi:hypothetical protein
MPGREPWTYLVSKDASPTNVTAVVKDRNNRARSLAAGVVSGAGASAGDSKANSDESAPSRTRRSLDSIVRDKNRAMGCRFRWQWKRRVRVYGWCRAQLHTRKG